MAGYVNSWMEQYTNQQAPCIADTTQSSSSITNCVVWLLVGLVIGSLSFGKKNKQVQS